MCCLSCSQAVLNTQYSFKQGALACRLRSALTCLVYDKTLLVSSVDMAAHSSGAVQTLMSVDADRVVNLFSSLHELWSLPLQIAIALCLLYTQVSGKCMHGGFCIQHVPFKQSQHFGPCNPVGIAAGVKQRCLMQPLQ